MNIKHLWLIGALLAATGCANHGYREGGGHNLYRSTYGNRDYARNCGYAMDELGLCGGYRNF
ncbi:MAG: hypothetical protein E5W06_00250 [Mesorhizobium sp.]|nr:MAG: hypothetical protein E5W06_00250 [Mesorhizobium sp.]